MSTKHTSKCLQNAADDEPIFVLRAQDRTAHMAIRHWVKINTNNPNMPAKKLDEAMSVADQMEHWHTQKLPD